MDRTVAHLPTTIGHVVAVLKVTLVGAPFGFFLTAIMSSE